MVSSLKGKIPVEKQSVGLPITTFTISMLECLLSSCAPEVHGLFLKAPKGSC